MSFLKASKVQGQSFSAVFEPGASGGVQLVTEGAFEGNSSALVQVSEDQPVVQIATRQRFLNPNDPNPIVYLEVNYRSEAAVTFGIIAFNSIGNTAGMPIFEAGFRAKTEWNKIYFNLSPIFRSNQFTEYQIVFQGFLTNADIEEGLTTADIYS